MKWVKTQSGRLVNLAQMSEVNIQVRTVTTDGEERQRFTLTAWEPGYTDTSPASADLSHYTTRAEADAALNDLHDWLRGDECGCDFSVKMPSDAPSFVREDRSGKLHFDDAADKAWREGQS